MSSANRPSSKLSNTCSTDAYEDDLLSWLQYPMDDAFDRSYCSDMFQGAWPPMPAEAAIRTNPDVLTHERTTGSLKSNTCETGASVPCASQVARKHVGTKTALNPRSSCNSNADEALAKGAARAAGYSSQVGQDAYSKVKTLMQPTHHVNPQLSAPCHSLNACKESKNHPIKLNMPMTSVPVCAPQLIQNAARTKLNMLDFPSSTETKLVASDSTMPSSKRARTEYEALSRSHQTESSLITEEGTIERGKMVVGADQKCTISSTSYSAGTSQTSISLSCRETSYSGKRKQEDLELSMEDADDESMDAKKRSKLSSRRNRVAEVHNLSERNRRNRINEKLKALQDLIPNSCKTDKASVLDEAIEYMKNLQMQLQMVSMRTNLNVSPMMMPMVLPQPHMHMAQPHSISLGVPIGHASGMGIGLGVGMDTRPPMAHPMATSLMQCPPPMSQHVMPFQSGNIAGFTHMGFLEPSQMSSNMQNMQQRLAYMHQPPQHEQGGSLLHRHPRNPDQLEGPTIEQDDDVSDRKD